MSIFQGCYGGGSTVLQRKGCRVLFAGQWRGRVSTRGLLVQLGSLLGCNLGINSAHFQRTLFGGHNCDRTQAKSTHTRTRATQGDAPSDAGGDAAKQQERLQGSRVMTNQVRLHEVQWAPRRAGRQQRNATEGAASHSSGAKKIDIDFHFCQSERMEVSRKGFGKVRNFYFAAAFAPPSRNSTIPQLFCLSSQGCFRPCPGP